MIHELATMLHCSSEGSYHQPIIIHQRDVPFDADKHGTIFEQYLKRTCGSSGPRDGKLGAIVTYCDMWTGEWEKYVWLNNIYIVGTKEYDE